MLCIFRRVKRITSLLYMYSQLSEHRDYDQNVSFCSAIALKFSLKKYTKIKWRKLMNLCNEHPFVMSALSTYSAIHKAAGLKVPTVPWFDWYYSIVPPFHAWSHQWDNSFWGSFLPPAFWEQLVTKEPVALWIALFVASKVTYLFNSLHKLLNSCEKALFPQHPAIKTYWC